MKTIMIITGILGLMAFCVPVCAGPDSGGGTDEAVIERLGGIVKKIIPGATIPKPGSTRYAIAVTIRRLVRIIDAESINKDLVIEAGEVSRADIAAIIEAAERYQEALEVHCWDNVPEIEDSLEEFRKIITGRTSDPEVDGMPALLVGTARTLFPRIPIFKGSSIPYHYDSKIEGLQSGEGPLPGRGRPGDGNRMHYQFKDSSP